MFLENGCEIEVDRKLAKEGFIYPRTLSLAAVTILTSPAGHRQQAASRAHLRASEQATAKGT